MTWTTKRRARKRHVCETRRGGSGCTGLIEPGETYAEHIAAPGDSELGNDTWWRLRECWHCRTLVLKAGGA